MKIQLTRDIWDLKKNSILTVERQYRNGNVQATAENGTTALILRDAYIQKEKADEIRQILVDM